MGNAAPSLKWGCRWSPHPTHQNDTAGNNKRQETGTAEDLHCVLSSMISAKDMGQVKQTGAQWGQGRSVVVGCGRRQAPACMLPARSSCTLGLLTDELDLAVVLHMVERH